VTDIETTSDPQSSAPLSVRNYTEINRALGLLNELQTSAERVERAGYDVTPIMQGIEYYRQLFNKIKAEFFKHRP